MARTETTTEPRRITLVADELLGYVRTGGLGTATSFLALALARLGHRVEALYCGDAGGSRDDWARLYQQAGVAIVPLSRSGDAVEPTYFGRMLDVERALAAHPPDVVITQDLAAPCYTALRLRHLGLAFGGTLFVVLCHGTRRWITDVSRKVRVLPGAHAITVLEQASLELADVVVSPNSYLVEWMRAQGWRLPQATHVIPFLTRSGATGEPRPERVPLPADGRVRRITFFGRLEERKGLRPFAAGLNALDSELLDGLELEFVGRATPAWPPPRVEALLAEPVRRRLARISFQTALDQPEALARLEQPGTLAVMPSLEDNSPNTVYECLERGIPFLASQAGGIGELVAAPDRPRVLFEPTAAGMADALRRALSAPAGSLRPARPAFDAATSLRAWAEVASLEPEARRPGAGHPAVDVVVVDRGSGDGCRSALERQSYQPTIVIAATSREAGLGAGSAPWVVFLDEEDVPAPDLVETLVRAQAASGADVVSCGLRVSRPAGDHVHLFAGEPDALALLSNSYGTVALIRRSLLEGVTVRWPEPADPDWPLLAALSASGAHVVSVPAPLVTRRSAPGALEGQPSDALLVAQQLEGALPTQLRSLARLAAGLAAELQGASARPSRRHPGRMLRPLTAIRKRL